MKRILPCSLLVLASPLLWPQNNWSRQSAPATFTKAEWTWVSGDNTVNHAGVYGTKGVAAPSNLPGSRQQAVSWTDSKGNFWIFGGNSLDALDSQGNLNDLWKFDGTNWTWVSGTNNVNNWGVYGTRGIPNANNVPGGRVLATSWLDAQGNVWLFGGNGQGSEFFRGLLNDLWKFDGTNWTWMSGSGTQQLQGMYATKGTPSPLNSPGSRSGASGWIDTSGHLWLFGGNGFDLGGSEGYLNDLWMFDGSNWTWVNGSNTWFHNGHFGTQGVPDPSNSPSGRNDAASWMDDSGNFWFLGGFGTDSTFQQGWLNDVWKFDGAVWTWIAGSSTRDAKGVYGTQGVGASGNMPGARFGATAWMEKGGVLWLFGGNGYDSAGTQGELNDLWSWNGTVWTWVSGSNLVNQAGSYGTLGVSSATNLPGARQDAARFLTAGGDLCLFGGQGVDSGGHQGLQNDLWRYRPGTNPNNKPPAPKGVTAAPGHGAIQLGWNASLGATSYTLSRGTSSGHETILQEGIVRLIYVDRGLTNGTKYFYTVTPVGPTGVGNPSSEVSATPALALPASPVLSGSGGPGEAVLTWSHTGTDYQVSRSLSSGGPYNPVGSPTTKGTFTDTSLVNGANYFYVVVATTSAGTSVLSNQVAVTPMGPPPSGSWTWLSGADTCNQPGSYGTLGVPSPANLPGARYGAASWSDFSGNFWLFGGGGHDANGSNSPLSDLWRFDGTNWTWMKGPNTGDQPGVYGTQGVAAPTNVPGGRARPASWMDRSGNFWVFGGFGVASGNNSGELNDLWRFDRTNWTWMKGTNLLDQSGVYGTKGVAGPGNTPGGRDSAAFAVDGAGNFWLFGGQSQTTGQSWNDLWKFDGTNWTWISGANVPNQVGTYGTKGVGAPDNVPGARSQASAWIDSSGVFWLFGGYQQGAFFNDLWKFDGTNWTWVSGPSGPIAPRGIYGTQGIADPANTPGARAGATSWIDSTNNLWLFGGAGSDSNSATGSLNDLWKFDGTNWTWVFGSDTDWQIGTYGTKGNPAAGNVPGARNSGMPFVDLSGRICLFGGVGFDGSGNFGSLNDLWRWGP
jgi:N-acetylneuraminic acid mutarotase